MTNSTKVFIVQQDGALIATSVPGIAVVSGSQVLATSCSDTAIRTCAASFEDRGYAASDGTIFTLLVPDVSDP